MEKNQRTSTEQMTLVINKLNDIPLLDGHKNYELWATVMSKVWRKLNMYELVVQGERPERTSSAQKIEAFESLCREAVSIFYHHPGVLQSDIMLELSRELQLTDPHIIWRYLSAKYEKRCNISNPSQTLIFQFSTIALGLSIFYESSSLLAMSAFIEKFEIEWLVLQKLAEATCAANTTKQSNQLPSFLDEKGKSALLLGYLTHHRSEFIKDMVKDYDSFNQLKQSLLDMDSKTALNKNSAQTAEKVWIKVSPSFKSESGYTPKQKEHDPCKQKDEQQVFTDSEKIVKNTERKIEDYRQTWSLGCTIEKSCSQNSSEQPKRGEKESPETGSVPNVMELSDKTAEVKGIEVDRFDYSKAPSLLYGTKREVDWKQSEQKRPFNPYSKCTDVSKGMRRISTTRAGRSHTFRR